jgi:cation transport ATPase
LRAGHVTIVDGQFQFFCDHRRCRAAFLSRLDEGHEDCPEDRDGVSRVRGAPAVRPQDASPLPEGQDVQGSDDWIEPLESLSVPIPHAEMLHDPVRRSTSEVGMLLFALTFLAAGMATALELAENTNLVLLVRVVLLTVATATLGARVMSWVADPSKPSRVVAVSSPVLAVVVAAFTLVLEPPQAAARACFLAGVVVLVATASLWLVVWAERPVRAWRTWAVARLAFATNLRGTDYAGLKAGESLTLDAGAVVPVDMVLTTGECEVSTWWSTVLRVRTGDTIVAGARVQRGRVTGRCVAAGDERTLLGSFCVPARRMDVHAPLARIARRVAEVGAIVASLVGGALLVILGWGGLNVALVMVGVYAAFANLVLGTLPGLVLAMGNQRAVSRGVLYGSPEAWRRCASATTVVFCARRTLLRGEPELVEIDVVPGRGGPGDSEEGLLAVAAAALSGQRDPSAAAVLRAAADRGLLLEAVRNPRRYAGRGVTAVAASGEALCVGTRSLMLERGVSVAVAENRVHELECRGRSVILVAREGRLIGLLALQDGLRAGARAAVQYVLDVGVEPVLVSPDTRETCEALGRALDIDHLRPEAEGEDKADVVRRLQEAGGRVAVVGHSPQDDDALNAAYTPVVMRGVGRANLEHAARTVSDDVRDAALALTLAHRNRHQVQVVLGVLLAGATVGALATSVGLLPAEYAPLATLLSAVVAVRIVTGNAAQA